MIQIGAQLYTTREFTKTPEALDDTLAKVSAMGYKTAQISAFGPIDPAYVAKSFKSNNLIAACTHISFERMQQAFDEVIKEHAMWDCKYIGVGARPGTYEQSVAGYKAFAKDANEIARRMKDQGFTFIYHNHSFEYENLGGVVGMDILFDEFKEAQFELDTYWVQSGGANPVQWIEKVAGRMDVVHFKDMCGGSFNVRSKMMAIGQGNLDWPAIIAACAKTGVKYAMVEQDDCGELSPFDCLKTSYDFLKTFKEIQA